MQKWLIKVFVQKIISFFPQAHKVNYQFQKRTTLRHGIPDEFFLDRLTHFKNHYEFFRKYYKGDKQHYNVLELGTGWHPIVPIAFYLSGAAQLITLDIKQLINSHSWGQTIQQFRKQHQRQNLQKYIPNLKPERLQVFLELTEYLGNQDPYALLTKLNIFPWTGDTCHLDTPDNTYDFIISNNVLQDIPAEILKGIFRELARVAKPGSLMSHSFDMLDQFHHFDNQITPYNFLQYSEEKWSLLTNELQKQNRERITFYRDLFRSINLNVLEEVNISGKAQDLKKIKLNAKFAAIPEADLLVLHSHIVGSLEKE